MAASDGPKPYAKAIAAFILPIIGNMVADLFNGNQPWPTTGAEWIRYLSTSLLTALGVYGIPNQITQKQLDKSKDIVNEVVLPEVAKQASTAAQAAVVQATEGVPVAGEVIADVTHQVGSVVDEVIRNFQLRNKPQP